MLEKEQVKHDCLGTSILKPHSRFFSRTERTLNALIKTINYKYHLSFYIGITQALLNTLNKSTFIFGQTTKALLTKTLFPSWDQYREKIKIVAKMKLALSQNDWIELFVQYEHKATNKLLANVYTEQIFCMGLTMF